MAEIVEIKQSLKNYLFWHESYLRFLNVFPPDTGFNWKPKVLDDAEKELLRTFINENKDPEFYTLQFTENTKNGERRTWTGHLFLSYGEAVAHQRAINGCQRKAFRLEIESILTTEIQKLSKDEILQSDAYLKSLLSRIESISRYSADEIESIGEDATIVWVFDDSEPWQFVLKGETLIPPLDMKKPFFGVLKKIYDEDGNIGILNTETHKIILPIRYKYIKMDGNFAEVSETAQASFDYRELTCDIIDRRNGRKINGPGEVVLQRSLNNYMYIVREKNNRLRFKKMKFDFEVLSGEEDRRAYFIGEECYDDLLPFNRGIAAVKRGDLWGYIHDDGEMIIEPQFLQGQFFFTDKLCAIVRHIESPSCEMVIDYKGRTVIEPRYPQIEYYKDDLFFIRQGRSDSKENRWALFRNDKVVIDFIPIKNDFEEELKDALEKRNSELVEKRYSLPLKDYTSLFLSFSSERDLMLAGLWRHPVIVKTDLGIYEDVIADKTNGTIGWQYPVSSNLYDFKAELPVTFRKKDGDYVSLGLPYDALELSKEDIREQSHFFDNFTMIKKTVKCLFGNRKHDDSDDLSGCYLSISKNVRETGFEGENYDIHFVNNTRKKLAVKWRTGAWSGMTHTTESTGLVKKLNSGQTYLLEGIDSGGFDFNIWYKFYVRPLASNDETALSFFIIKGLPFEKEVWEYDSVVKKQSIRIASNLSIEESERLENDSKEEPKKLWAGK